MKIEKHLGLNTSLDTRTLPNHWQEQRISGSPQLIRKDAQAAIAANERFGNQSSGFSLQLNQQLSALQSADQYLERVSSKLMELKMNISRQLSGPISAAEREASLKALKKIEALLSDRAKLSGQSLDSRFTLRLNEPIRARFSLEGLTSIESIKAAGNETLVFTAGRHFDSPLAVTLTEGASTEDILRRFNVSLGQEGIRAELDESGALKFSAPEVAWQKISPALKIQGEGKLAPAGSFTSANATQDKFLHLPQAINFDSARDLRQMLDGVVTSLDKIHSLRDQIAQRQQDVKSFLEQQSNKNDSEWAEFFALRLYNLQTTKPSDYQLMSQFVTAQSHLSRFTVVSLLS